MPKLLIIALSTVVLGSCTTTMERARDICYQIGDPSSSCVERQFNTERARGDAYRQQQTAILNSESPPSPSQPPTESEYDRRARKVEDQAKAECESKGMVFKKYGTGWVCEKP